MKISLPDNNTGWRDWHVPFSHDQFTLEDILASAMHQQAAQDDVPLIVQLIENPKFDVPWITLFNGAVNLTDHDCIHALLGRGFLPKDEAFVIGFTMGSTNRTNTLEQKLYTWASKYLYPGPYKFSDEDAQVFKDAVHLGYVSDCTPLNTIDFSKYLSKPVNMIRDELGIETDLIESYFRIEKRRYLKSKASQRLL
ncbi:hypothetical protein MNBD_GAMMA21-1769 [hydrothermal vent metagenome]|uniref:Uncharacterized protein n=1 Tax=hydrothermal vent metagenome TaxID=652676 RepID=A0A3B0ZXN2_9ZZZZ